MDGVFYELRNTLNELRTARADWRRIARRALPVAAAAAAGAGALCARKALLPPEKDLLSRSGRVECEALGGPTAASLSARGLLPTPTMVERSLRAAGADPAPLRRAAARLRGPLEADLLAAEGLLLREALTATEAAAKRRQEVYTELVGRWRAAGHLEEPVDFKRPRTPNTGIDYVTQVDESYGRDVGSEVPLCLLRPPQQAEPRSLSPEDTAKAATKLQEHGVVMLGSLLGRPEVDALRETLKVQVSALDRGRTTPAVVPPVREYDASLLAAEDPGLEPVVSTAGRRHFYLRGRALEEVVSAAQAGAMPLVWEHLMRAKAAAGLPEKARPYVSEVQLLVSDPCAVDQFWHVDNTAPGLTLFVPLTQVPEDLGVTVFLPGSHHLFGSVPGSPGFLPRVRGFFSSFLGSDGIVVGAMGAGDALVYDSRIVHRGAANRKYDRTRVALVFRYDFERPPGIGPLGTQLLSWTGNSLAAFQRFYAALPSGGASSSGGAAAPSSNTASRPA